MHNKRKREYNQRHKHHLKIFDGSPKSRSLSQSRYLIVIQRPGNLLPERFGKSGSRSIPPRALTSWIAQWLTQDCHAWWRLLLTSSKLDLVQIFPKSPVPIESNGLNCDAPKP